MRTLCAIGVVALAGCGGGGPGSCGATQPAMPLYLDYCDAGMVNEVCFREDDRGA
jgi:hypothetical protein